MKCNRFSIKTYIILFLLFLITNYIKKKIRIGILSMRNANNIGNCLIKFAMHIKLSELGYEPYIIVTPRKNINISFINRTTNIVIVKKYSDIKENDYDILMVNSDQTWRKWDDYFYDRGFLRFAEKWNKLKFVYGASLGFDYWDFNETDEKIINPLIKKFSEISVREKGSIKLINKHFGISPKLVLDPTLIIDKKYYLNLIKNYKDKINNNFSYIFLYNVYKPTEQMKSFIKKARKTLNYEIYNYNLNYESSVEEFLYRIKNSNAVITNSFHCTIFSIIFKKPFISFNYNYTGIERLKSLSEMLVLEKRIIYINQNPEINLLTIPPNINYEILKQKKRDSINFLKRNLKLYNYNYTNFVI